MFPIIPLLGIFFILGGGATLTWYARLSPEQQTEADRIACGNAKDIFGKGLKELTKARAEHVASLTKRHFVN